MELLLAFALGVAAGIRIWELWPKKPSIPPECVDIVRMDQWRPVETQDTESEKPTDYAVDRKPRKTPWPIRRRELEAAARTKRKAMEEYR